MDTNDLRSLLTALGFLCFIGIVVWAFSKRNKQAFDEAARLPLMDEDTPGVAGKQDNARNDD